jgi:shikimate kinase
VAEVVLVGLPGSGKTTTGRALAQTLALSFADTDDVFRVREGLSVQEFLRTREESDFRHREVLALMDAVENFAVVATGGGVVTTPAGRAILRAQPTVWLDCGDDEILTRVVGGDRPLLEGDAARRLATLRRERSEFYSEVSRRMIDTARESALVLADLVDFVQSAGVS